jgi:hypothetical protein
MAAWPFWLKHLAVCLGGCSWRVAQAHGSSLRGPDRALIRSGRRTALLRGEGFSRSSGPPPSRGGGSLDVRAVLCLGTKPHHGALHAGGGPFEGDPHYLLNSLVRSGAGGGDSVSGWSCILQRLPWGRGDPGARPPVNVSVGFSRPSGPSLRGCVGDYGWRRRVVAANLHRPWLSLAWLGFAVIGSSLHDGWVQAPTS